MARDRPLSTEYARLFGHRPTDDEPEAVLVNVAKALAAYQETIVTARTPFDDFRDALGTRRCQPRSPAIPSRPSAACAVSSARAAARLPHGPELHQR